MNRGRLGRAVSPRERNRPPTERGGAYCRATTLTGRLRITNPKRANGVPMSGKRQKAATPKDDGLTTFETNL
jgi:hypothetical protein